MPTTLTRSAEQVILVASMIASRLLLGPCAALQQVQVLLEVAIQHHYDIMPAQHFEHRFQRLHGPSQETKLKLQLLLASLRSKCAALRAVGMRLRVSEQTARIPNSGLCAGGL